MTYDHEDRRYFERQETDRLLASGKYVLASEAAELRRQLAVYQEGAAMRFIIKHKADHGSFYSITLANRPDEERYKIVGDDKELDIHIEKSARFSSAEKHGLTPEEDNKRWFDSFDVGSEFNLSPKVAT